MKKLIAITLLGLGLLFSGCSQETLSTPKDGKAAKVQKLIKDNNLKVVTFEDVQKAIADGTRKKAKALVIDARPIAKYNQSHIPSSIALPDTKFKKLYKLVLGKVDKNKPLIIYCGGLKCAKSPKLAIELLKKGHKDVAVYTAGMPEWSKKSYDEISIKAAVKYHEKQNALFLDARPYSKFAKGTILGSLSTPDTKFENFKKFMPRDLKANIITYCGGFNCHKSHVVANELLKMGYTNVKVFAAGYPKWKKKKYPTTAGGAVVKKPTKPARKKLAVVEPDMVDGVVKGTWFIKNYKNFSSSVTIVDIRSAEDYAVGHLQGAINIPAEKLSAKDLIAKLPKGEVIFTCNSGAMALEAFQKLKDAKYSEILRVFYLDANIDCDKNSKCKIEINESI